MAKYIPLDALVAEIDRKQKEEVSYNEDGSFASLGDEIHYTTLESFKHLINTLKVKEVDLEKETTHYLLYEHRSPLNEIMHKADLKSEMQYHKDVEKAFKAGFELGLNTSSPISGSDRGMAGEIITHLKKVESDYRINLTREIGWLREKFPEKKIEKIKKGE